MNLLTIENINKSYSEKVLLKDVSLTINEGDKIGIIGINGAGKSTLLKIISGKEEFFEGKVTANKNIRIEYLSQNPEFNEEATVLEQVFRADSKELNLIRDYENLVKKLEKDNKNEELNKKLIKIQEEIDSLNLWEIESEAKNILNKLGITDYNQKIKELSGGQKKRVSLATALITPSDLLILDEPTNHLDSFSIEWLEAYLNNRNGALIMITHDRYFLDVVANRILELDRGTLYQYQGNYSKYLEKKAERLEMEEASEQKRQSLIKKELKWVKRGAKARSTKQKARLERFNELVNQEYKRPDEDIEMQFIGTRLGSKIINIDNITKTVSPSKTLIKNFSYIFTKQDRIGIVGPNGAGKTTLINLIRGKIQPDSGLIEVGETVKIGCFSQENFDMDNNMRVIDFVKEDGELIETQDGSKITASTMCEKFLFDSTLQYTKIEKLSGGERRRLQLLRVLMGSPNVLLFDEPTNDLDIKTLTILEDFLDSINGVIIIVSHDRFFLDRICNKMFSYEGNGIIKVYNGNFSDYELQKEFSDSEAIKEDKVVTKNTEDKNKTKTAKLKFSYNEAKEYDEIENIIADLEENIESKENEMVENATNYSLLQTLTKDKESLEEELLLKYERYEYLENLSKMIEENKKNR